MSQKEREKETETKSIVLVGVGGQGILLASEVLAQAAMLEGYEVKTNEVHGMAQRGGSVVAQVRYGPVVHSPLVARGSARVLGALEQIEALRFAEFLSPDGLAVVNAQAIVPVSVSSGAAKYPQDVESRLKATFPRLAYIQAAEAGASLGSVQTTNIVVLGAVSKGLDLPEKAWQEAIAASVRETFRELNLKAFEKGRSMV
jgi:indolepyruvate ferredoxin oxidoreductase beta subunit